MIGNGIPSRFTARRRPPSIPDQAARILFEAQGTLVFGVYAAWTQTWVRDLALPKTSPSEVAFAILDGIEAGQRCHPHANSSLRRTIQRSSRNLTPNAAGETLDGDSFEDFRQIIRTGVDPDQIHPVLPFPFDGHLLQIMPWPAYKDMTDRDLRAIYEYLGAIPCVPGPGAKHPCS
jgi:hypothetical protein